MLGIGLTAERFGVRPSALLEISNSAVAFDFDQTAALRLVYHELELKNAEIDALNGENQNGESVNVKEEVW